MGHSASATRSILGVFFIALSVSNAQAAPLKQQFVRIWPETLAVKTTTSPSTFPWPSLSPVIPPGVSPDYNAERFEFIEPGLYAFDAFDPYMTLYPNIIYDDYNMWGNYIVYDSHKPNLDVFVGAIGKLIGYGAEDKDLTIAERMNTMRSRIIWLQCGDTAELVNAFMADQYIPARRIHVLAKMTFANATNRDDGHVLNEIYDGIKWRLYDVTQDGYFADTNDHINALELFDLGTASATFVRLAPTEVTGGYIGTQTLLSPGPPPRYSTPFQIRNYYDIYMSSETKLKTWRERVFAIYGWAHPDNNEIWWLNEGLDADEKAWVLSLSSAYRLKDRVQITAQFYQSNKPE